MGYHFRRFSFLFLILESSTARGTHPQYSALFLLSDQEQPPGGRCSSELLFSFTRLQDVYYNFFYTIAGASYFSFLFLERELS